MERVVKVAITKNTDIRKRTKEALDMIGGIEKVVGRGDKVFIKPNLVDGAPFVTGEVVQLETIELLVRESLNAGASEVVIGETPTYRKPTETILSYERLARNLGARFLELSNYPFVSVKVKDPVFFDEVRLSKPLLDSDVFINVPTLKTHCQCGITVAIKNMYGLIPPEDRHYYHMMNRVEEATVDLYKARGSDLIVVDGTYTTFHIGRRPISDFKETHRLDLTLAGFDPVAVDTVSARLLGIDPSTLRFLRWAEEEGLGTGSTDEIKIVGASMEEARYDKAVDMVSFVNAKMKNSRVLNFSACTGCLQLPTEIMRLCDRISRGRKLVYVMGPNADAEEIKKNLRAGETVILCGYCAAPTFYNNLDGHFIPGCPPQPEDLLGKIKEILGDNYTI
jgi:uncharacterized protein (DUF362 family)